MTQKELLYYEDAVMHEENIVKILENNLSNVESSEIKEFIEGEINSHNEVKNSLIELMEGKVNG